MDWLMLFAAGLLEIAWAIGMKYSQGFSKPLPSALTLITMVASFALLAAALRTIPVGTGYAVWTGIGAAGTAILGMILFAEPVTALRILFLACIIAGVLGLKFAPAVR